MNTLVIGAPHAGKTTWARENLRNGILYDLDLIADALTGRVNCDEKLPHPVNEDAREIANQLLTPIIEAAKRCRADLTVIRAAPTPEEAAAVHPARVIWIRSSIAEDSMGQWTTHRLKPCIDYLELMGFKIEEKEGR